MKALSVGFPGLEKSSLILMRQIWDLSIKTCMNSNFFGKDEESQHIFQIALRNVDEAQEGNGVIPQVDRTSFSCSR